MKNPTPASGGGCSPSAWSPGDKVDLGDGEIGIVVDAGGRMGAAWGWLTVRTPEGSLTAIPFNEAQRPADSGGVDK